MAWLREIDLWLIEAILPHGREFRKAAARVVGQDDADDIVQEAYAKLLTFSNWREISSPRAYCLTVIRNLAVERMRRSNIVGIDRIASLDELNVPDDAPDAFRQSVAKAELEQLLRWIDDLPAQCGRVVRMRKLDGLSPSEIAVSLGVSISTVETHLAKGLVRLTQRMREIDAKGGSWPKTWARLTKRR